MSYLFDKAFQITLMVIFLLVFMLLVIVGFIVLSRVRRKNKREEDDYFQKLERYDAQDYLDFEGLKEVSEYFNV